MHSERGGRAQTLSFTDVVCVLPWLVNETRRVSGAPDLRLRVGMFRMKCVRPAGARVLKTSTRFPDGAVSTMWMNVVALRRTENATACSPPPAFVTTGAETDTPWFFAGGLPGPVPPALLPEVVEPAVVEPEPLESLPGPDVGVPLLVDPELPDDGDVVVFPVVVVVVVAVDVVVVVVDAAVTVNVGPVTVPAGVVTAT
jgi:hypothetical protein